LKARVELHISRGYHEEGRAVHDEGRHFEEFKKDKELLSEKVGDYI
jgi:hypothetical protein